VTLAVQAFGGIGAFRPGDMTGLCVLIRNPRPEALECLLQWDLPNADGDVVSHHRSVTLAPEQTTQRWLYARLAPSLVAARIADEIFTLRLYETKGGVRIRELTTLRFRPRDIAQPSIPVEMRESLIAMIGDTRAGLETLEASAGGTNVPAMQEVTRLARNIKPANLPDRWEGFSSAEAMVWLGSTSPQTLGAARAGALLEWISRGGHLVIALPETADPWSLRSGGAHALSALLPTTGMRRVEGLQIHELLPVLAKVAPLRSNGVTTTATLFNGAKLDRGWKPFIQMPATQQCDAQGNALQGDALVVQKLWGHGRITLIGIDVEAIHRQSLLASGVPQADVFWNRILGRRADSPTETEYRDWADAKVRQLARQENSTQFDVGTGALILSRIGLQGRATAGVMSAIVFFIAYWLLAVPVCWIILRKKQQLAWNWPIFAVLAVLASLPAWALGLVFGGSDIALNHLTVVDFIVPTDRIEADDPSRLLRADAWISASLNGFGTSILKLNGDENNHNLLIDWSPPPQGSDSHFPDTARSERGIDDASQLQLPSRGTTSDLQAQWLGAPPASWGAVAWQQSEQPVRVVATSGSNGEITLNGSLRHSLPSALHDVTIVHVMPYLYRDREWVGTQDPRIEPSALPPHPTRMVRLAQPWDGSPLDLGKALYPQGGVNPAVQGAGAFTIEMETLYRRPLDALAQSMLRGALAMNPFDFRAQLCMLSLYQMLQPPAYRMNPPKDVEVVRVSRWLARELDLSPWFARPCVIVIGFLDNAPCPLPLTIDGATASSNGDVMVRFILPLPCEAAGIVTPFTGNAVP